MFKAAHNRIIIILLSALEAITCKNYTWAFETEYLLYAHARLDMDRTNLFNSKLLEGKKKNDSRKLIILY